MIVTTLIIGLMFVALALCGIVMTAVCDEIGWEADIPEALTRYSLWCAMISGAFMLAGIAGWLIQFR